MKRSELYALVWEKPVVRLARELGVSDVGLAKACRRHDIPIPPRGHWTKLQFAKASPQFPLPPQDSDAEIHISKLIEKSSIIKKMRSVSVKPIEHVEEVQQHLSIDMSSEVVKSHPLVRATKAYVDRLPKIIKRYERTNWLNREEDFESPPYFQHGRYSFAIPGGLVVTASLDKIDWLMRFFNCLFAALAQDGARALRTDVAEQRNGSKEAKLSIELAGESLSISMSEGYRKQELDAEEFRLEKQKASWTKSWRYVHSESFTLHVSGTEHSVSKEWRGTSAAFEKQFSDIVITMLTLLRGQPKVREERLQAEEIRRAEAARAEEVRQIKLSKAEQLKKAFALANVHVQVTQLKAFLDTLEAELSTFDDPYQDRARVWISVVRKELAEHNPYLDELKSCLSPQYSWTKWPPLWWPSSPSE